MPRMTTHCALSGLKMHLYQRVIRACWPGKRSAAGQSRRVSRLCRMAADALSGLRYLAPGSAPSQAQQAQRRRAIMPSAAFVPDGGSRLVRPTLFGAGFRPLVGPASAAPPGNIPGTMPRCAGWRLTPYPAYVIWRRVPPLSRPGKRSAAGQYTRHHAALCRMAADALSGLRYLAPGSPPSQARQAQRRRAITPSAAFVPDGG